MQQYMMMGSASVKALFLISAILLSPFVLRTVSHQLEVYPSVVLPSGAVLANSDSTAITATKTELIGRNVSDSAEVALDARKLIAPLPINYLPKLLESQFALAAPPSHSLRFKYIPKPFRPEKLSLPRKLVSEEDERQVRSLLRERLQQQDCSTDTLTIRRTKFLIDKATREVSQVEITDEVTIDLI
ncbi:hypothetical protein [Pelagicoccus sp. SDUM812002]|uniref:hypothetical protein n=1 Tax=Pelagicoccus sp. SDUM812002 TaxID=3041266 RepID=UPI002810916C|nr:hypothetical protein [Pelagicoccus sp. SDUM812002]MDQ8185162.1 hypothetical protein [Pelagicoccus sp. SDUM812002]